MDTPSKFDLEDRLVDFTIMVMDIVEMLPNTKAGNTLGNQLIRCCVSPALNYGEAQAAESRSDFIHKMKVVHKELKEVRVCMKIIQRRPLIADETVTNKVMKEVQELIQIFGKSIQTAISRK
jgi:four helix bundle protein